VFQTYYRYFKYLVIPFELTNVFTSFQAIINYILQEYLDVFIIIYLDNILIYLKTLDTSITKRLPFYTNYMLEPKAYREPIKGLEAQLAID